MRAYSSGFVVSGQDTAASSFAKCARFLLVASVFAQKFAIPFTVLPLNLALTLFALVFLFATRAVSVSLSASVFSILLVAWGICSILVNLDHELSFNSFFLFCLFLGFCPLRMNVPSSYFEDTLRFFAGLAQVCAVIAVAQFVSQFVIGRAYAFPIETFVPPQFIYPGFNALNPLSYGSPILKANGVVFGEPSLLSQWLGVGFLAEIKTRRRPLALAIILGGLLTSYSGTGFIIIACGITLLLPFFLSGWGLAFAIVGGVTLFVFAQGGGLDLLLSRVNEFQSDNSSASARFQSIGIILWRYVWTDPLTAVIGRGPGTVKEYFDAYHLPAFDPTWGKMLYEYGFVGFTLLVILVAFNKPGQRDVATSITVGLIVMFFFLGGYLLNANVHLLMFTLFLWPQTHSRDEEAEPVFPS